MINVIEKYDSIVIGIEESKDISKLSMTELMGSLDAYEKGINCKNENLFKSAFYSMFNIHSQKWKPRWKKTNEKLQEERVLETQRIKNIHLVIL